MPGSKDGFGVQHANENQVFSLWLMVTEIKRWDRFSTKSSQCVYYVSLAVCELIKQFLFLVSLI